MSTRRIDQRFSRDNVDRNKAKLLQHPPGFVCCHHATMLLFPNCISHLDLGLIQDDKALARGQHFSEEPLCGHRVRLRKAHFAATQLSTTVSDIAHPILGNVRSAVRKIRPRSHHDLLLDLVNTLQPCIKVELPERLNAQVDVLILAHLDLP